jgi:uncharacterized protein (DUF4415 family)
VGSRRRPQDDEQKVAWPSLNHEHRRLYSLRSKGPGWQSRINDDLRRAGRIFLMLESLN